MTQERRITITCVVPGNTDAPLTEGSLTSLGEYQMLQAVPKLFPGPFDVIGHNGMTQAVQNITIAATQTSYGKEIIDFGEYFHPKPYVPGYYHDMPTKLWTAALLTQWEATLQQLDQVAQGATPHAGHLLEALGNVGPRIRKDMQTGVTSVAQVALSLYPESTALKVLIGVTGHQMLQLGAPESLLHHMPAHVGPCEAIEFFFKTKTGIAGIELLDAKHIWWLGRPVPATLPD